MKKILFLSILTLLFVAFQLSAEQKTASAASTNVEIHNNSVKGLILDKLTKETLAGAVITANGQKVYSDLDGNFSLSNLCDGKCQLKVSMISYQDQIIEVNTNNNKSLEVKLQQH
jgi:hypothetical protein